MPARSVTCILLNATARALTLDVQFQELLHGEWMSGRMPPSSIAPGSFGKWESESGGFMTGTEGVLSYNIQGIDEKLQLHWNNPYAGSNWYGYSHPPGFKVEKNGGNGDNATVTFILTET
jgi:hypothetical protein